MSRRGSAEGGSGGGESEVVILKRRRLVAAAPLYAGLARFNFLLDATQPGGTPDALFMAALLDLVSFSFTTRNFSCIVDSFTNIQTHRTKELPADLFINICSVKAVTCNCTLLIFIYIILL